MSSILVIIILEKESVMLIFYSFQSRVLHSSISVSFSWLYGMLSQKKAESLLQNRPVGTFLVRIHRKRLSHILSYRFVSAPAVVYHLLGIL